MGMSPLSMEEVEDYEVQVEDEDEVDEDAGSTAQSHIDIPSDSSDLDSYSKEPNNEVEASDDELVAEWLETESDNDDFEGSDQEDATESVQGGEHDAESLNSGTVHPATPPEAPAPPSGSGLRRSSPPSQHSTVSSSSSSDSKPAHPAKRAKRAPVPTSQPIPRPRAKPAQAAARASKSKSNPRRKQCPHCPNSYISLNRHVDSVHRKLRPNKCRFCHQGFSDRSRRDQHQRGRVCLRRMKGLKGEGEESRDTEDEQDDGGEDGRNEYEYDDDSDSGIGIGGNMGGEGEGVRQLVVV
ncbi:hypothetical protein ACEPPN_005994 [Leptodophora sp. 'Broadleaf-Isolate-01']